MGRVKNFIGGVFISLSKVEKDTLTHDSLDSSDGIAHEQQVRKHEIKIVSKKRFYQILSQADEIQREKYKVRNQLLSEQRGLGDVVKSFKNARYGDFFEENGAGDDGVKYKFKTSNGMYKYASSAYMRDIRNGVEICFVLDLLKYPNLRKDFEKLGNLNYFEVNEYAKIFSYGINEYLGFESPNDIEIIMRFRGNVIKDGEMPEFEETERVMRNEDLISPIDTINFNY